MFKYTLRIRKYCTGPISDNDYFLNTVRSLNIKLTNRLYKSNKYPKEVIKEAQEYLDDEKDILDHRDLIHISGFGLASSLGIMGVVIDDGIILSIASFGILGATISSSVSSYIKSRKINQIERIITSR